MKHKPNKNHKGENKFSPRPGEPGLYRHYQRQQRNKLQLEDYLTAFPTCNLGSADAIYLDEITVYYSFN